jgi:hypothetical protein
MASLPVSVQPLLDQFRGEGLMVSCYADLWATPGAGPRWPGPFKSRAAAVKEMLADDPGAWRQFEDNFEAIGRALEGPDARHARGMAVFSARQRGFFDCLPLDVPVENELVDHEAPYLVPLLQTLCRQRDYLVVLTNTHRGRLYAATRGGVRLLHEIERAVPSRQRSAGERWGKEQATIARHRADCILHYQKELVELIDRTWAEHAFGGIVLLGEHEVVEHVRKRLPPRLAEQVVHEAAHAWTARPLAVDPAARAALAGLGQAEERRLLDGLEERRQRGSPVAVGPRAVVDALQAGRVGPRGHGYLVLVRDPREAVARCTACRSLFADMPAACPRCQAPCVDANLWEEILLLAMRHDVAVHCVKTNDFLARCGGAVAVLPEGRGDHP